MRALEGWDRSGPRALLDRLRERLTPQRREAIAKSDYGMAWTKHHRVLVEIHATGLLLMPLHWYPLEALELYCWKRGADTNHELRAFACVVLALDAVADASTQIGHICNVLAPLLESAWTLDLDNVLEAALVWLAEVASDEVVAWPLFSLVLTRARRAPDDPRLGSLVPELIAAEAAAARVRPDTGWLLRTTDFNGHHELWPLLANDALEGPLSTWHPPGAPAAPPQPQRASLTRTGVVSRATS